MTQSLSDFFRQKKELADAESRGVDWNQRRQEWLNALTQLYATIESFVKEAKDQGNVTISRRDKRIAENHLGIYMAPELVLSVGDEEVIFSPKGRNVIGAQGRVDARGESGEAFLVLQPGPRWGLVVSRQPTLKVVEFNGETFAEMLRGITRR